VIVGLTPATSFAVEALGFEGQVPATSAVLAR
jgi:hypothetical protein